MANETKSPVISFDVRVKPGRAGTDPEAPDWEVCELEDGVIKNNADIYDNMTLAEANQIAGMWRSKKEEAEAAPAQIRSYSVRVRRSRFIICHLSLQIQPLRLEREEIFGSRAFYKHLAPWGEDIPGN